MLERAILPISLEPIDSMVGMRLIKLPRIRTFSSGRFGRPNISQPRVGLRRLDGLYCGRGMRLINPFRMSIFSCRGYSRLDPPEPKVGLGRVGRLYWWLSQSEGEEDEAMGREDVDS